MQLSFLIESVTQPRKRTLGANITPHAPTSGAVDGLAEGVRLCGVQVIDMRQTVSWRFDGGCCSAVTTAPEREGQIVKTRVSEIIMEYLVKISKKARILELKRRHLKITDLTSYTPYPSRKIRRICACTSQETTKIQSLIRRIQENIQDKEIKYSGRDKEQPRSSINIKVDFPKRQRAAKTKSTKTSDGLAAIQSQLNSPRREIKKVNEKVYAAQVGCEICKGPHYTKDCPLKEEGKTLEEASYTQFGAPYQLRGLYRAARPGFYQRNNKNSSYPYRRQTIEESLIKFMAESAKRHEEN
ncbi:hypothetical protein Tco_0895412 [Tanacetum coccineum]|uniref:Eukaryotic translation initiation factor 3 subunit G N-terminal domain-containing protein n=1 Tax=Tanacetum coccineum TaxID=301880 RepID=A0ABQ5CEW3_9ASTR